MFNSILFIFLLLFSLFLLFYSPDSLGTDGLDHVVTSPDSVSQPYVTPPAVTSLQPLWRGNVTMHAMPTFSASAYYVSGRAQGLTEVREVEKMCVCLALTDPVIERQREGGEERVQSNYEMEDAMIDG